MSFQYEYGDSHSLVIFHRSDGTFHPAQSFFWILVGDEMEDITEQFFDPTPVPENWELVY